MTEYREEIIENPDFLHLRSSGRWSVEHSNDSWQRLADLLSKSGVSKVLIDERDLVIDTNTNLDYTHAAFVSDLMARLCRKVALLDIPENSEQNRFFETVCVNRGLNLKFFLREQEAVDWLRQE